MLAGISFFMPATLILRIKMKPVSNLTLHEHEFLHQYFLNNTLLALDEGQLSHYNKLMFEGGRFRRDFEISDEDVKYRDQVRQIQGTWGVVAMRLSLLEGHHFTTTQIMHYAILVSILNLLGHHPQLTYIKHFSSSVDMTPPLPMSDIRDRSYLSTLPLIQKSAAIKYLEQVIRNLKGNLD